MSSALYYSLPWNDATLNARFTDEKYIGRMAEADPILLGIYDEILRRTLTFSLRVNYGGLMYPEDTAFSRTQQFLRLARSNEKECHPLCFFNTGRPTDDEVNLPTIVYERAFLTFTPPRP